MKKYCECYQAGVKCTSLCKCELCKNCDPSLKQSIYNHQCQLQQQQQIKGEFSFGYNVLMNQNENSKEMYSADFNHQHSVSKGPSQVKQQDEHSNMEEEGCNLNSHEMNDEQKQAAAQPRTQKKISKKKLKSEQRAQQNNGELNVPEGPCDFSTLLAQSKLLKPRGAASLADASSEGQLPLSSEKENSSQRKKKPTANRSASPKKVDQPNSDPH